MRKRVSLSLVSMFFMLASVLWIGFPATAFAYYPCEGNPPPPDQYGYWYCVPGWDEEIGEWQDHGSWQWREGYWSWEWETFYTTSWECTYLQGHFMPDGGGEWGWCIARVPVWVDGHWYWQSNMVWVVIDIIHHPPYWAYHYHGDCAPWVIVCDPV